MANSNVKSNENKTSARHRKKQTSSGVVSNEIKADEKGVNEDDKKKQRKQQ